MTDEQRLNIELRVYSLAFEAILDRLSNGDLWKVRSIGDSLLKLLKKELENYEAGLKEIP